jgi:hypothetical protein
LTITQIEDTKKIIKTITMDIENMTVTTRIKVTILAPTIETITITIEDGITTIKTNIIKNMRMTTIISKSKRRRKMLERIVLRCSLLLRKIRLRDLNILVNNDDYVYLIVIL